MTEELDDTLYARVCALSERADDALEDERQRDAVAPLVEALKLLPEPKQQWEAYTWINGSLGEALFTLQQYRGAREVLFDAMNGPDGQLNPFILLRLGQTLYELGERDLAKQYLARAHMLEGDEIFEAEDPKYIEFLTKQ